MTFRKTLDEEMKDATKSGVAQVSKMLENEEMTETEEAILWDMALLGANTAESLLNTVYFYNGKLFGLRTGEHRLMRLSNTVVDGSKIVFEQFRCNTFKGIHSKKERCLYGVSQGSVLGSLLFLLYINDIYNSSDKLSFYLFADDTNLLYADKNLSSLETVVNEELRNIGNWLRVNTLSLNVKKSNFVIFRPYQKRIDYEVNIKIFDYSANSLVSLESKECVRYLGVLFYSNLSWKHHHIYFYQNLQITRYPCKTKALH